MKKSTRFASSLSFVALTSTLAACPNAPDVDDGTVAARSGVKNYVNQQLIDLHDATVALQAAAPDADADGWNATDDAAAVAAMKAQWKKARLSYERVEGAIAVLFPDLDESTDQRYDGFHESTAFTDDNLFDGEGVTGVHAVERILFSDEIPDNVVAFEEGVVGARYVAPSFPTTEQQADDFKNGLMQRLVDDTATMRDQFADVDLALEAAYRGVLGSVQEQFEKVRLAGDGSDESRYAQHTLADMRANLEGGLAIFESFDGMFDAKDGAEDVHDAIHEAFERVDARYAALDGDAIPAVPATWNPDDPSADDAATAYGSLFLFLQQETNPADADSFVSVFNEGGDMLGIPQLAE